MMATYLTTQLVTSTSPTHSFPHYLVLPLILKGCHQISVATWLATPSLNHHCSCLDMLFTTFLHLSCLHHTCSCTNHLFLCHSHLISLTTSTLPSTHFSSHATGIASLTPALPPWPFTNVTTHTSSHTSISNHLMKPSNIKTKAYTLCVGGEKRIHKCQRDILQHRSTCNRGCRSQQWCCKTSKCPVQCIKTSL